MTVVSFEPRSPQPPRFSASDSFTTPADTMPRRVVGLITVEQDFAADEQQIEDMLSPAQTRAICFAALVFLASGYFVFYKLAGWTGVFFWWLIQMAASAVFIKHVVGRS